MAAGYRRRRIRLSARATAGLAYTGLMEERNLLLSMHAILWEVFCGMRGLRLSTRVDMFGFSVCVWRTITGMSM